MALIDIFRRKAILGIDIDLGYIKIVSRNERGILTHWMVEPIPEGLIQNGKIISDRELGLFIREKLKKAGIRGKKCGICLSSEQVIIRKFCFPIMVQEALEENIRYEIAEFLSSEVDDYVIDYRILDNQQSSFQKNQLWVMAVAVHKEIVNSYINAFEKAGLKPMIIDVPPNCQEIWYNQYISTLEDSPFTQRNVCLIYIGKVSIRFTLLHEGEYYIDKQSKNSALGNEQINIELFIQELFEILNFYYTRHPDCKINNIVLMADKAQIERLAEQIERRLELPVYTIELPIDSKDQICLPNAIGVSIIQNEKKKRINLIEAKRQDKISLPTMLKALLAMVLILGIGIYGVWRPISRRQELLNELKALEIEKEKSIDVLDSYEEIKSEIEYITNKKLQLDKVVSEQVRLSELLGVIDDCLSTDIYIMEISADRSTIKILGRANDDSAIAQLLVALDKTRRFDRVFISEITLEQITGLKLFRLECDIEIYKDLNQDLNSENMAHYNGYTGGNIWHETIP